MLRAVSVHRLEWIALTLTQKTGKNPLFLALLVWAPFALLTPCTGISCNFCNLFIYSRRLNRFPLGKYCSTNDHNALNVDLSRWRLGRYARPSIGLERCQWYLRNKFNLLSSVLARDMMIKFSMYLLFDSSQDHFEVLIKKIKFRPITEITLRISRSVRVRQVSNSILAH